MPYNDRDNVVEKKLVKPARTRSRSGVKITGTETWTTLGDSAESVVESLRLRIRPERR